MSDGTFELALKSVWSVACAITVGGLLALIFRNQIVAAWHRLWRTPLYPARHRLHIEEPAVVTPEPIIHPHDDLPETVRQMLARRQAPAADGRGRRWAEDVLHGETGMHPIVVPLAIAAAPAEVEPELVGAVA